MNIDQLKNQIIAYLKIAKIPQEEKDTLIQKLPNLDETQLNALKTNLMQQVVVDIYFDELEAMEKSGNLLDDSDLEEMGKKVVKRLDETKSLILSDAELNQIRASLQSIQQSTKPAATPVQSSSVTSPVPITPVTSPPVAPVVPVETTPVSPVPPEV